MPASAPVITAYTADISICSQICRLAIHEHNLDCEHVNIDIEGAMDNYNPWFVKIQPKMTVPAMKYFCEDEEVVIGDSKDIMHFLAAKHSNQNLYPEFLKDAIDTYINLFYSKFGLIAAFTFGNLVRRSDVVKAFVAKGKNSTSIHKLNELAQFAEFKELAERKLAQKTSGNTVKWAESQDVVMLDEKMGEMLQKMEVDLADGRAFITGGIYTLADVVATAYCARIHFIKGEELFRPLVRTYWTRMKARPSFQQAYVCWRWEDAMMSKQVEDFALSILFLICQRFA